MAAKALVFSNWPRRPLNLRVPSAFPRKALVILTVGRWADSERYKGAGQFD